MGFFISKNEEENKTRRIFIDLLLTNNFKQPENYCGNSIKTTRYSL